MTLRLCRSAAPTAGASRPPPRQLAQAQRQRLDLGDAVVDGAPVDDGRHGDRSTAQVGLRSPKDRQHPLDALLGLLGGVPRWLLDRGEQLLARLIEQAGDLVQEHSPAQLCGPQPDRGGQQLLEHGQVRPGKQPLDTNLGAKPMKRANLGFGHTERLAGTGEHRPLRVQGDQWSVAQTDRGQLLADMYRVLGDRLGEAQAGGAARHMSRASPIRQPDVEDGDGGLVELSDPVRDLSELTVLLILAVEAEHDHVRGNECLPRPLLQVPTGSRSTPPLNAGSVDQLAALPGHRSHRGRPVAVAG
jgi:hypothetical protein